jgi:hypothetical protein
MKYAAVAFLIVAMSANRASATEICGNDLDDDNNGMVDEGCAPTVTTGVCESPLSCGTTGMVSWATGALHYDLPADVAPKVPYGPGVGLRRFYTSAYAPSTGPVSVNHTPLGARWQHTYMSWIDRFQVSSIYRVVLHTSEGRDVYGTYSNTSGGWEYYTPQAGYHVMSIRYNTASPNQFQVQLLTGETLYYNSSGQLTQIWDSLPTPNKVMITWTSTSGGNVSTVTDASGKRRLKFNYTSNLLRTVNYQLLISGTWTTQQTSTYNYTSGTMTSASIGASLTPAVRVHERLPHQHYRCDRQPDRVVSLRRGDREPGRSRRHAERHRRARVRVGANRVHEQHDLVLQQSDDGQLQRRLGLWGWLSVRWQDRHRVDGLVLLRGAMHGALDGQQRVGRDDGAAVELVGRWHVHRRVHGRRAVRLVVGHGPPECQRSPRSSRQLHLGDLQQQRPADADRLRRQRRESGQRRLRAHDLPVLRHDLSGPHRRDAPPERSRSERVELLGDQHDGVRARGLHLRCGHAAAVDRAVRDDVEQQQRDHGL